MASVICVHEQALEALEHSALKIYDDIDNDEDFRGASLQANNKRPPKRDPCEATPPSPYQSTPLDLQATDNMVLRCLDAQLRHSDNHPRIRLRRRIPGLPTIWLALGHC